MIEPGDLPTPPDAITVTDVAGESRFVLRDADVEIGELCYRRQGSTLVIDHTGIDPAFEGRGLAGRLTDEALRLVIERGERIVPLCSYTVAYLRRHPELAEQVLAQS